MSFQELKSELLTGHPVTGPYNANSQSAVDQLYVKNRTRNRTSMTGSEVLNSIDKAELAALSATNRQKVWDIIHIGEINPFGVEKDLFVDAFGSGSITIANLQTLRVKNIHRVDELQLGEVHAGDVSYARSIS